jgi:hypothetical protein
MPTQVLEFPGMQSWALDQAVSDIKKANVRVYVERRRWKRKSGTVTIAGSTQSVANALRVIEEKPLYRDNFKPVTP